MKKNEKKTFIDWPIPHIISSKKLAKRGFYYTRIDDYISCVYCSKIFGKFNNNNNVQDIEREFCSCLIDNPFLPNIPLNISEILKKLPLEGEEYPFPNDLKYVYSLDIYNSNINININDSKKYGHFTPKISMYKNYEDRLCTFKNWPKRVGIDKREMCSAGFIHNTKCK